MLRIENTSQLSCKARSDLYYDFFNRYLFVSVINNSLKAQSIKTLI